MTLIKNVNITFAAKVVAMLFWLLQDIFIARILGIELYSSWTLFYSLIILVSYIAWMGINASTKVIVSKQTEEGKKQEVIYSGFILRLLISIIVMIIIYIMLYIYSKYSKNISTPYYFDKLLMFSGGLIFFNCFNEFYKEISIGTQSYGRFFLFMCVEYGGSFIFTCIALFQLRTPVAIALGTLLSGLLIFYIGAKQYNIDIKRVIRAIANGTTNNYKTILRYAIPMMFSLIGATILVEIDTVMLGILGERYQVGYYNIAKSICSKAAHINYAIATGTMTSFSLLASVKNAKNKFRRIVLSTWLVTIGVIIILFMGREIIIKVLYGENYLYASQILITLLPYYLLYGVGVLYSTFLDFQGKVYIKSVIYVFVAIIDVALNCILIPKLGAIGAALATSISLCPYTIFVILYSKHLVNEVSKGRNN